MEKDFSLSLISIKRCVNGQSFNDVILDVQPEYFAKNLDIDMVYHFGVRFPIRLERAVEY